MPARRGILASVLRTLSFHVATLAFACVLGTFFAVSGSLLLLVVGCLLVGSAQFARKLTRILWHTEMAIDALVVDEEELGPVLTRRRSSGASPGAAGETHGPILGEVTMPVMLLSMLYFLVFKWILDMVFCSLPLVLWLVSIAQVLPDDADLSQVKIVVSGTAAAQVFTALAFAFLAHQVGVTSARGLLFVSRNVAGVLFARRTGEDATEHTERVSREVGRAQEERQAEAVASNYGTMSAKHHQKKPAAAGKKPSAEAVARNLYREDRSASDSSGSRARMQQPDLKQQPASFDSPYVAPGMPPMPSMRELPHAERVFQNDVHNHDHDQEIQACCCKVVIKSNTSASSDGDGSNSQHEDSSAGHRDSRRRGGGGRGGGFSGGRGGFPWGAGRGGLRFDQMRFDIRGPPPVPPFNGGFPPWTADWRERWREQWAGWQDWSWPDMNQRRRRGKGRRGMRRRNSFDDVYAVAVPVAATVPDDEEDRFEKPPAHESMYEALDLSPSAPPLPLHRPRWGSDDARWERSTLPDTSAHATRHDSMHKSMSEPVGRRSLQDYWGRGEAGSDFDSEEDDDDDYRGSRTERRHFKKRDASEDMRGLLRDRHHVHRRLSEMQDEFRPGPKPTDAGRSDGEVAGEQHNELKGHPEQVLGGHRQKHTEWKQRRYERKMQKYEQKLRTAREKLSKRHDKEADLQERYVETKERDRYAKEIDQAADEVFRAPEMKQISVDKRMRSSDGAKAGAPRQITPAAHPAPVPAVPSAPLAAPPAPAASSRRRPQSQASGDPRKRALSSRVRGRPSTLSDHQVRSTSDASDQPDRVEHDENEDKRSVSIAPVSQAGSSHDISDLEIRGRYGNITRSYEDDDVTNMRAYAPLSYTGSPPQYVTALDPSPIYRGPAERPDYDSFSPMASPRSIGAGRDSFEDTAHEYDVLSPTNSFHDADFSTDKFQQVYRSIQMAAGPPPRRSASTPEEGGLDAGSDFKGVPGRRDRVNFSAFAPPSVCPSPKPFQFTVWAFLLNQRADMQELAKSDHPESRKLSLETKLDVRRGALVHVTLEVPTGFEVLNGATQGFAWEGDISSVDYDVVCTEGAAFGRVLFKARITVGSSVAVLNSFVLVGSRAMDPSELEVDVLEGWMDVMEQTYREIPYRSLQLKELVGQGYFGDAYRASLEGQDVVVKTIRASEFGETTSQIVREFQHEAAMLNMFGHHPCVVPFVGASTDTKFPLALVTKYLPYGSLEDNLRGANSSALSVDERTGMLKDASAGLLNIHEGGFIHRDLAARNCLVDQGKHVRICDFGLCRRVRSETAGMLMKDAVGPVKYMAPESLQPPHAFSYDSDVYMFGVLMWETFTGSPPFSSLTPVEAMMHVLRGERLPVPKELPASLQTLMQSCFHDSPAERPSMQEVLTALEGSLGASRRASAAIAARTSVARATAAAATSAVLAKSVAPRASLRKDQDRSIWV